MPDGPRRNGPGYDDDFYAWTQYQAEVLRSMPAPDDRFDRLSPTLRRDLEAVLDNLFATARKRVITDLEEHGEQTTAASLPTECPYTLDQILDVDWYPEPPGEAK